MQKLPEPSGPPIYVVGSVDNALRLLQMLRDRGEVRLRVAAAELGVAESTAHRLLAMLVYRGFAIQDESRVYLPGPGLGVGPTRVDWTSELIEIASPHMRSLRDRTGETINLMIRVGTMVRFLWSEEGTEVLRIVSREGVVLPARHSAAGKLLLADLTEEQLRRLYQGANAELSNEYVVEPDFQVLLHDLQVVSHKGLAIVSEGTERGVSALAVPLHDKDGQVVAAVGVAAPSARIEYLSTKEVVQKALTAGAEIDEDLRGSHVHAAGRVDGNGSNRSRP